jgi:cytochrome P450
MARLVSEPDEIANGCTSPHIVPGLNPATDNH